MHNRVASEGLLLLSLLPPNVIIPVQQQGAMKPRTNFILV
jgi:hypothetical protein